MAADVSVGRSVSSHFYFVHAVTQQKLFGFVIGKYVKFCLKLNFKKQSIQII